MAYKYDVVLKKGKVIDPTTNLNGLWILELKRVKL